jgi:hypothetical protein
MMTPGRCGAFDPLVWRKVPSSSMVNVRFHLHFAHASRPPKWLGQDSQTIFQLSPVATPHTRQMPASSCDIARSSQSSVKVDTKRQKKSTVRL